MTKEQLAEVAHRIRNPLNTISVNAELARLQIERHQDAEKILLSLNRILQGCKDCSAQLDSLTE